MVPRSQDRGSFALDLIREALGAVATANARDRIIRQALYSAGAEELPDDPVLLHEFVRDHLHMAVEFALGPDTADALIADLAPLMAQLRMANVSAPRPRQQTPEPFDAFDLPGTVLPELDEVSQVRASASLRPTETTDLQDMPPEAALPSKRPTVPAPALCLVLLATRDKDRAHAFAEAPSIGTIVQHVEDALSLMDNLVSVSMQPSIVVIDCLRPSVQPATLAAMSPDLAANCDVILWGASEQTERELRGFPEVTTSWVRVAPEAAVAEVATLCTTVFASQLRRLLK